MPSLACHAGAGSNSLVRTAPVIYCCLFTFPSSTHAHTHAPTHTHSMQGGCRTRLGRSCAGAVQGWGSLGCSSLASQRSLSLEERMCSILYINPGGPSQLEALDPSGCSPHLWVFVWGWDLELSCRAAQASAMCLCGGDGSWLRHLSLGSAGSKRPTWMCISGWAWCAAPASSRALQQGLRPQCLLAGLPGGSAAAVLSGCPAAQ